MGCGEEKNNKCDEHDERKRAMEYCDRGRVGIEGSGIAVADFPREHVGDIENHFIRENAEGEPAQKNAGPVGFPNNKIYRCGDEEFGAKRYGAQDRYVHAFYRPEERCKVELIFITCCEYPWFYYSKLRLTTGSIVIPFLRGVACGRFSFCGIYCLYFNFIFVLSQVSIKAISSGITYPINILRGMRIGLEYENSRSEP